MSLTHMATRSIPTVSCLPTACATYTQTPLLGPPCRRHTGKETCCTHDPLWKYARVTFRKVAKVRITTRQTPKCKSISGLPSKNTTPLASLARFFSPSHWPFLHIGPVVFQLGEWKFLTTHQFGECLDKLIHTPESGDLLLSTLL
jgi:hypothetical protein